MKLPERAPPAHMLHTHGFGHILEGRVVQPGNLLELQRIEWAIDAEPASEPLYCDDWMPVIYHVPNRIGPRTLYERALYELLGIQDHSNPALLRAHLHGYEVLMPVRVSMRFRWPEGSR